MRSADYSFQTQLTEKLDSKSKPIGALGDIEALAEIITTIQETLEPCAETALINFAHPF